jgi:hypothetical protein
VANVGAVHTRSAYLTKQSEIAFAITATLLSGTTRTSRDVRIDSKIHRTTDLEIAKSKWHAVLTGPHAIFPLNTPSRLHFPGFVSRAEHFVWLTGNNVGAGCACVPHQRSRDPQTSIRTGAYLWSMGYINPRHLQFFETMVYTLLVLNIEIGSAFIEKKDSRLSIERSGEHHSLLLSA